MIPAKSAKQERRAAEVEAGKVKAAPKRNIRRNPNPKTSRKAKPVDGHK